MCLSAFAGSAQEVGGIHMHARQIRTNPHFQLLSLTYRKLTQPGSVNCPVVVITVVLDDLRIIAGNILSQFLSVPEVEGGAFHIL